MCLNNSTHCEVPEYKSLKLSAEILYTQLTKAVQIMKILSIMLY